jgi:hypothetical protein
LSITAFGLVLGGYSDANSTNFGYLMTPFGGFIQIAVPGDRGVLQTPFSQAPAVSINPLGVIAGTYVQPVTGEEFTANYRAFVRFPDGTYVTFDAADYPPCCIWSGATGIDPAGTIAGTFNDGFNLNHGFWRTRRGTVTTFDVPGAGTGSNEARCPSGSPLRESLAECIAMQISSRTAFFSGQSKLQRFLSVPEFCLVASFSVSNNKREHILMAALRERFSLRRWN